MFRRHYKKRSTNIFFVIFRLFLSLAMFVILLSGIYAAYKHFSGLDPLKIDPQAIFNSVIVSKAPKELQQVLSSVSPSSPPVVSSLLFRFLLVADSHSDNSNLEKAISLAKSKYKDLKFIIGLGDYSEVGTVEELQNTKKVFDASGIRYFLIPGDHDLWDCRNKALVPVSCFSEVFGSPYQAFTFEGFKFLLLDNSDNYTGFDSKQLEWIATELERSKEDRVKGLFVFAHEPLFHPSSDRVMGWVEKNLKAQAGGLIFQLKEMEVKKVFAGNIHYFSEYSEPQTQIPMLTIGAITLERNPQTPRFAVVSVFEDGSSKVEDMEIK